MLFVAQNTVARSFLPFLLSFFFSSLPFLFFSPFYFRSVGMGSNSWMWLSSGMRWGNAAGGTGIHYSALNPLRKTMIALLRFSNMARDSEIREVS